MRIEYEKKSMVSKLVDIKETADKNKKNIECVYLSDSEWDRLAEEICNAWLPSMVMASAYHIRNGWAVNNEVRFCGMTIRLEPNVKT